MSAFARPLFRKRRPSKLSDSRNGALDRKTSHAAGYIPALDGIRGYMAIGVLLTHTRFDIFPGAAIFMDVFFVISGFLITSILLSDYERHGRIDLIKFYKRRFARLSPPLIAMLIFISVFFILYSDDLWIRLREVVIAFFYMTNYAAIYFNSLEPVKYTAQFWSLSVEEQFYIVWAIAISLLLLRIQSTQLKRLALGVLAVALLVYLGKVVALYYGVSKWYLYSPLWARADSLLIGCALAIFLRHFSLSSYPTVCRILSILFLPLILLSLVAFLSTSQFEISYYKYWSPLSAVGAAIVICAILQPIRTTAHTILEWRPLVYLGIMSYSIYIWHWPIFSYFYGGIEGVLGDSARLSDILIAWPIVFVLAFLSFQFIERPFMRGGTHRKAYEGPKSDTVVEGHAESARSDDGPVVEQHRIATEAPAVHRTMSLDRNHVSPVTEAAATVADKPRQNLA